MEHEHACKRESCWLKHLCIKEGLPSNIYDLTFSPEMPKSWLKNPNEWLSSLDIINVMKQWEQRYKCFNFIGPSPIDYDTHKMFGECVWDELCKFNLNNHLKNKKKKIGVIFNLDPHYKSGSHWVAVFMNDIKKTIYYFDSYGDPPHPQIKKFIDNVINQSTQLGSHINIWKIKNAINLAIVNVECIVCISLLKCYKINVLKNSKEKPYPMLTW